MLSKYALIFSWLFLGFVPQVALGEPSHRHADHLDLFKNYGPTGPSEYEITDTVGIVDCDDNVFTEQATDKTYSIVQGDSDTRKRCKETSRFVAKISGQVERPIWTFLKHRLTIEKVYYVGQAPEPKPELSVSDRIYRPWDRL